MPIRRLPPDLVNRIAAGEVIERPASAVKELIENALDAGAKRIEVQADGGGLSRILVADDGAGLSAAELPLALERHATSKLGAEADGGAYDLLRIATLGFRGEALPSIASVSRLTLRGARSRGAPAFAIPVEGGAAGAVAPCAFAEPHGARVEVRDLFYATPARLKFVRSERAEAMAIAETVKRGAMARREVAFSLDLDGRKALRLPAEPPGLEGRLARLAALLGRDFADNALALDQMREGVRLSGYAGLPTFHRGNAAHQYLFVNGRPVRDRLLQGALRAAYADHLARDRHPVAALFVELDPAEVDVNVHPAKAEVRFRDAALVRGLIVGGLRHALAAAGHRASTTVAAGALASFPTARLPRMSAEGSPLGVKATGRRADRAAPRSRPRRVAEPATPWEGPAGRLKPSALDAFPLGAARAQLHGTYILAQTRRRARARRPARRPRAPGVRADEDAIGGWRRSRARPC